MPAVCASVNSTTMPGPVPAHCALYIFGAPTVVKLIDLPGSPTTIVPTLKSGLQILPLHAASLRHAGSAQSTSPLPSSSTPLLQISIFIDEAVESVTST